VAVGVRSDPWTFPKHDARKTQGGSTPLAGRSSPTAPRESLRLACPLPGSGCFYRTTADASPALQLDSIPVIEAE